jgi:hypothetical protein
VTDLADLAGGDAHARRVARRLEARGMPGLAEVLVRIEGRRLRDGLAIGRLYAVGAEGAVFGVEGASKPLVAKIPLVPYHRPADLSSGLLRRHRGFLLEEGRHLMESASPFMPRFHSLLEFENPLLDHARGGAFGEPEPVLLEERLPGQDADLWLARVHRFGIAQPVLRRHLDRIVVGLLQALCDLGSRGYLYADLRPGNMRIVGRPDRRVKLLDAGGLAETSDDKNWFPHVPHYLPPDQFERLYVQAGDIRPSAAAQAVMAGRSLYEVATGRVPVPGKAIDVDALRAGAVSPPVADVVERLAAGAYSDVLDPLRFLASRATRRVPVGHVARAAATPARVPAASPAPRPATLPGAGPIVRRAGFLERLVDRLLGRRRDVNASRGASGAAPARSSARSPSRSPRDDRSPQPPALDGRAARAPGP